MVTCDAHPGQYTDHIGVMMSRWCSTVMLQRYLGNKTSLTGEIVRLVSELCPLGSHVCDAFAGSLAVSVALRRSGYRVSSNDINLLSWVYGVTYLANTGLPEINFADLIGSGKVRRDLAQQTRLDMGTEPPYDPDLCVDHSLVQDWKILIATMFSNYGYREISTKDIKSEFAFLLLGVSKPNDASRISPCLR